MVNGIKWIGQEQLTTAKRRQEHRKTVTDERAGTNDTIDSLTKELEAVQRQQMQEMPAPSASMH